MITRSNLPSILGEGYDPTAQYAMVETHTSGRAGSHPSPRRGQPGHWKYLTEASDPEVDSSRTFRLYQWVPAPPKPKAPAPVTPDEARAQEPPS